jgi:hypothetical protein
MSGEQAVGATETLYVSWGGTGRAASLREAMTRAGSSDRDLVYLAVLDDGAFGDVDGSMLELVRQELAWLLDTQLDLTRRQTNLDDLDVRVEIRAGDVIEQICEVAGQPAVAEVLVGAPGSLVGDAVVSELVATVGSRVAVPIEVVDGADAV